MVDKVVEQPANTHGSDAGSGAGGANIRVLLVDDHEVVRKGLRLLLETTLGYQVVEASGAVPALAAIDAEVPDVVLLDARMPEYDGIWALQQIRERYGELPVIMLSTYDSSDYVDGALEHGADGYLLKDASSQQLSEAVSTAISRRGLYLHPQVARRLVGRQPRLGGSADLSERERAVLSALVAGAGTDEMAAQLHMAPKTVKAHLTSIFRKLGVANRTQAVAKALREGLVDG